MRTLVTQFYRVKFLFLSLIFTWLAACATNSNVQIPDSHPSVEAQIASLHIVDCLLPGQVRSLGKTTYLTPRRPIKTTAADCNLRGGEFVAYDRANYQSALKVWLPAAEGGDANAQVSVGEIFERGANGEPNYAAAAIWYQKAAKQGNRRGQFNLGTLYEQGLGVEKDSVKSLNLYRLAWGLPEDNVMFQSVARKQQIELERENEALDEQQKLLSSRQEMLRTQLSGVLQSKNTKIQALRKQITQLESQYSVSINNYTAQKKAFDEQHKLIQDQSTELNAKNNTINQQDTLLSQQGEMLDDKSSKLNEQQNAIDQQDTLLSQQGKMLDDKSSKLNEQQNAIDQQDALLSQQGGMLDAKNSKLNEQGKMLDVKDSKLSEQQNAIDQQDTLLSQQGKMLDAKDSKLSEQQNAIDQQDTLLSQQGEMLDAKDSKLSEQQNAINAQNAMLGQQGEMLADQKSRLSEQTQTIDQQESLLGQQGQTIGDQKTKLNEQTTTIGQQDTLLSQQGKMVEDKNTQLSEQTKTIDQQDALLNQQGEMIADKNTRLSEQSNTIDQQDTQLSQQGDTINNQNTRLNEQTELARLPGIDEAILDEQKVEISQLKMLVASLEAERSTTQQELSALPRLRKPEQRESVEPLAFNSDSQLSPIEAKGINFGRYYALIIGNQNYQFIENLETTQNDAVKMAKILEEGYGFDVKLLLNADRVTVMETINNLNEQLTEEDNLLIYYAGHGSRIQTGSQEQAYWLPVNADPPPKDSFWVSSEFVTNHLARYKAKRVLVVADSCYAGLLSSSPGHLFLSQGIDQDMDYVRYKLPRRARLLITSGGDKPVIDSGGDGHSVFARVLIDTLKNNKEILSAPKLFLGIKEKVKNLAQANKFVQVPDFKSIKGAGHEVGDFFFVPKG